MFHVKMVQRKLWEILRRNINLSSTINSDFSTSLFKVKILPFITIRELS